MKFEEALEKFRIAVYQQYGSDAIVKIGIEPNVFDQVMSEMFDSGGGRYSFQTSNLGEVFLRGIQLLPRARKKEF